MAAGAGAALLLIVAVVVLASVVVAGSGFAVDLGAIAPAVERRAEATLEPLRVRRGALGVRWGGLAHPVVLRADGWALLRPDGGPLLDLPRVEIAFAARPLLRRELHLLTLTLIDPRITIDRDASGVFAPDLALDELAARLASGEGGFRAALEHWTAGTPAAPLERLERARIENGALAVHDHALGLEWGAEGVRAEVTRRHPTSIELGGKIGAANGDARAELPFDGAYDLRHHRLDATLAPDLALPRLAALHPKLARLADLDLGLAGTARVSFADGELVADPIELEVRRGDVATGQPVRASARWASGSQSWSVVASSERCDLALLAGLDPGVAAAAPLLGAFDVDLALDSNATQSATLVATLRTAGDQGAFSSVRANVSFPPAAAPADVTVEIESLRPWILASRDPALAPLLGIVVPFDGTLRGSIDEDAVSLRLELVGRPGTVQMASVPVSPLVVDALEIQGDIDGPARAPRLEHGELRLQAGAIQAAAKVVPNGRAYSARVEVTVPELGRSDLDRYWPADLMPERRAKVATTFVSGVARDVRAVAELGLDPAARPPVRLAALDGHAVLDRVVLDVLAPQPPVEMSGSAAFDLDSVNATIDRAHLRDIELGPGTGHLSELRGEDAAISIDTSWRAPLESVLALLAAEPLSLIKHHERVAGITGSTRGEIHLEIPLREAAEPKRARIRARGELVDLDWANGPLGLQVSRGRLTFNHSGDQIELTGQADAATSPTRFSLRHRFDGAEPRDELHVTAQLDADTASALGLPEQSFVDGSAGIDATYTAHADGTSEVRADVDLTPARLELAAAGVAKAPGEAARARVEAAFDRAGTLTVRSLSIEAPEVEGTVRFVASTDPFRIESAAVDRLRIGHNELAGTVARRADGQLHVTVDAKTLDLRPSLTAEPADATAAADSPAAVAPSTAKKKRGRGKSASDTTAQPPPRITGSATAEAASGSAPFDFEAKVDRVLLLGDVETGRFDGSGSWDGERFSRLKIDGAFDPSTPVSLDLDRGVSTGGFRFETNDFGRLLRALVSRAEIEGGKLLLTAARTPEGDRVAGHLSLRSFTLIKMPIFASILQLGTLDSLFGMFQDKGLEFKKLDADLEWDGRRLSVTRSRAVGGSITFTGEGDFDLPAGSLDFGGTVARMGMVQRTIAKIPGLSHLLLGRDRAGVVATGFRLSGATADPEIHVQPLSTFTPGFLRDVVDAGRGTLTGNGPASGKADDSAPPPAAAP